MYICHSINYVKQSALTFTNLNACKYTHAHTLYITSSLALGGFLPCAFSVCVVGLWTGIQVVGRQLTHSQAAWRWCGACCQFSGELSSLPA